MSEKPVTNPVEDSVPKVGNEVAVGEDLNFQRKWWRFERLIWSVFFVILILDVLGVFGRGWLAKTKRSSGDQTLTVDYERIERASTPSIMTLHFGPAAVHNGLVQVFVSDEVIKKLGAQRISPQPAVSALSDGGITYSFDVANAPTIAQIALQPSFPGLQHFRMQVVNAAPVEAKVFVFP